MDIFSILQDIEKVPELRFRYIGSNTSDKVRQRTNYSFAKSVSDPSNDRGAHWIKIARLDKILLLWWFFEIHFKRNVDQN